MRNVAWRDYTLHRHVTPPQLHRRSDRTSLRRYLLSKAVWMLLPALCVPSPAFAEIFKCTGKNGADLYQNFPCGIDSLGSLPSNPSTAKTTSVPGDPTLPSQKISPTNVASIPNLAKAAVPRIGMTPDEVRGIWGEPEDTFEDELIGGRVEVWRYGNNRSVQFSRKHRVLAVQP